MFHPNTISSSLRDDSKCATELVITHIVFHMPIQCKTEKKVQDAPQGNTKPLRKADQLLKKCQTRSKRVI
ncbi:uncharacterized protein BCR38DRAFT_449839 [Pseudomassariella vexata]|uniref:Uncharacterized protein n=1 Tax=Pseudomassariella vexata TaxID=1141098 RepID=A0A1Y2DDI3_9PEZI|nr:uncharacterized protein BCR38DRAFT_449839 [Pseudomassariella vexata]ORY57176.1 hypothetical protein BCR38DRAFT_449839 [Pseudomassariella vexata]